MKLGLITKRSEPDYVEAVLLLLLLLLFSVLAAHKGLVGGWDGVVLQGISHKY